MAFHDSAIFPDDIAYGSQGGPGFNTNILTLDSGHEIRVSRWAYPKHRYDISYGIKTLAQMRNVIEFFHARMGPAHGFRIKDFSDFSTDTTRAGTSDWDDVVIGTGNGSLTAFQLSTKYSSGGIDILRPITKPMAGTVKVGLDGTESTSGFTVNYATGIVTFTSAVGGGVSVKAGCQFHVPVRFSESLDEMLPVRHDAFDSGSIDSIPLVEVKDIVGHINTSSFGGARTIVTTTSSGSGSPVTESFAHNIADGRFILTKAIAYDIVDIVLPAPDVANIGSGGPFYIIQNQNANGNTLVKDSTGTLHTLAVNKACSIYIGYDGGYKHIVVHS